LHKTHPPFGARSRPPGLVLSGYAGIVRPLTMIAAAFLAACSAPPPASTPARQDAAPADPTANPAYAQSVQELEALNRQAQALVAAGKSDQASAVISATDPLENRLLSVPHPTLAAMEAAADRDDLYGRMLLSNHNYGWARMTFQKNVIRWKNWKPQTAETARRLQAAQAAVAECDRKMAE
jgi:hypothetical protein